MKARTSKMDFPSGNQDKNSFYGDLEEECHCSPYGDCMCDDTEYRYCGVCSNPISPYYIKSIFDSRYRRTSYHIGCLGRYKLTECGCGKLITPYGAGSHDRCDFKVTVCLHCNNRITPYSPDRLGGYCSSRCHQEYWRKKAFGK